MQLPVNARSPSIGERALLDVSSVHGDEASYVENALPYLAHWQKQGEKTALVTLVERDGSSPRPIGAQMAIGASGLAVGHIAADCLHEAIVEEAKAAILAGENRLVRYGKGSPYIDLKLPCGSGIDLYFDVCLAPQQIETMARFFDERKAFTLSMDMATGKSEISPLMHGVKNGRSGAGNMLMQRNYFPPIRLLIAGNGPSVLSLARLAAETGFSSLICSTDDQTLEFARQQGFEARALDDIAEYGSVYTDDYTAVVLLFHDHEKELPVYQELLPLSPFYLGAMGSRNTHLARIDGLRSFGFSEEDLARIKGPIGLIPVAKSPSLLALSVLSDILNEAQLREFVC